MKFYMIVSSHLVNVKDDIIARKKYEDFQFNVKMIFDERIVVALKLIIFFPHT